MTTALDSLRQGCRASEAPCMPACPCAGARNCSPYCAEATRALSSHPDTDPLEPGIAPLIFQLKKLRVFQPYWSCEGHADADGKSWKVPRVWFYSDDVVHARILSDCLSDLRGRGVLACRWQVALTYCEPENCGAAFALEPAPDEPAPLAELQADARRIADALPAAIEDQIRALGRG